MVYLASDVLSSRCQSRLSTLNKQCILLELGASSGAKQLRGMEGVLWVGQLGLKESMQLWMHGLQDFGEDLVGRNGYFVIQGEERGKWADLPWLVSAQGRNANKYLINT